MLRLGWIRNSSACAVRLSAVLFALLLPAMCHAQFLLPDAAYVNKQVATKTAPKVEHVHKFVRFSPAAKPQDDTGRQDDSGRGARERAILDSVDERPENDTIDDSDVNEPESDQDETDQDGWASQSVGSRVARIEDGRFILPELAAPTIATNAIGNGRVPDGFRGSTPDIPRLLPESGQQRGLDQQTWPWAVGRWAAANTYSSPRYFEDRMLERHGLERYGLLQPVAGGARFFATVPMLPYLMTLSHPAECESTLGYYRTGSCPPLLHQRPPFSGHALLVESAAIATGIIALP